ncbi:MAG: GAF domain-containing sensor histidine kinase [Bacteroidales bacterium]|nr:GAF domain-containing sensor histidine kinase [Bacteroidales bacterium]
MLRITAMVFFSLIFSAVFSQLYTPKNSDHFIEPWQWTVIEDFEDEDITTVKEAYVLLWQGVKPYILSIPPANNNRGFLTPNRTRLWIITIFSSMLVIIIFLLILIVIRNGKLKQNNLLLQKQKREIEKQNEEITFKNEQISKSIQRSEMLGNFGKKLTSTLDIDIINNMMYNYLNGYIKMDAFGIGLYKEESNEIVYPAFIENMGHPKVIHKSLDDGNSMTVWSLVHQRPIYISDVSKEYKKYVRCINPQETSKLSYSRVHIPLTVEHKKIGILVVNSFEKNAYSEDDFINLSILSSYVAIALDNASNYELLKKQTHMLFEHSEHLKETNTLLEERQQQIEEQSELVNEQKVKLESLNETKDKLLSIIAHDLNNPLNTVIGFTDILKRKIQRQPIEKTIDMLGYISQTVIGAHHLLENLLQWSRFQLQQTKFTPIRFNLHQAVNSILDMVSLMAQKKGNTVINNIDPALEIYADKYMIETVIRNLVTNANKFTLYGEISISTERSNNHYKISVRDNGMGIQPEVLDKLFIIEKNKSSEGTSGEKGTGLGLVICKEFIDQHHGKIWAESELGQWTEFCFEIPALDNKNVSEVRRLAVR